MFTLLNAGFGEPVSGEDWHTIRELGFDGIRNDVPRADLAAGLAINAAQYTPGLSILIADVRGTTGQSREIAEDLAVAIKATGATGHLAIELGNEEDISGRWSDDPEGYGKLAAELEETISYYNPKIRTVTGGISSLSKDALAWLAAAMPYIPDVAIGYHPYRHTPPGIPRSGYSSRAAEFAALRAIAGDRPIWCTEVGWHSAPRPKPFPFCMFSERYGDGEIASFLRTELRLNHMAGAEVCCIYQLNDGPDAKNDQDRFGIRRTDGTLKPQAAVVREWSR